MSSAPGEPVVFISYSHMDEPERTPEGEIYWLREIQSHLRPAIRRANGRFGVWTDAAITGGADWESDIKAKLAVCDICILLVSRHSLASEYVIDVEIETIQQRQAQGHKVQIYPIALSPFAPETVPAALLALNVKPRLDKPLSSFSYHDRGIEISKIVTEIVRLLGVSAAPQAETPYVNLVGPDAEPARLDDAWHGPATTANPVLAAAAPEVRSSPQPPPVRSLRLTAMIAGAVFVALAAGGLIFWLPALSPSPRRQISDAVPFAQNAVALSLAAHSVVASEAAFLKENPKVTVTIKGYCTPEEGRRFGPGVLATLRTNKVRDELVARGGIPGTRITHAATATACNAEQARVVIVQN